ncbi:hypothetical protein FRC11_003735, partial [Ceratobasidium sp. 423]
MSVSPIGPYITLVDNHPSVHAMTFWIVPGGSGTLSLEEVESASYTNYPIRNNMRLISASLGAALWFFAD